jgi:quercetin dioxygenase-like cupin family protein
MSDTAVPPTPDRRERRRDRLIRDRYGLAAVAGSLLLTGLLAFASASTGASEPVKADVLVRAALPGGLHIDAAGPTDVVVSKLRIKPAASTIWHSHSGPVVVSVLQGTAGVYRADGRCEREQHVAGDAWVETPGQVHQVRNEGNEKLVLYVVSTLPKASPLGTQAAPPAECGS